MTNYPLKIAIPAYIPAASADWSRLRSAATAVSIVVMDVGNPGGPGASLDATVLSNVQQSQSVGQKVIGYVDTSYGVVTTATAEAQIDSWYTWYNVDGIFFDQVTSGSSGVAYMTTLYNYVKGKSTGSKLVLLNFGTQPTTESYMAISDIICNFEGISSDYINNWGGATYPVNPSWVANYSISRFWHLAYRCSGTTDLITIMQLAVNRHAGYIYVTPDGIA